MDKHSHFTRTIPLTLVSAVALSLTGGAAGAHAARAKVAATSPSQIYFAGKQDARFTYRLGGSRERDLVIELVRKADRSVVKSWRRNGTPAGQDRSVSWGGRRSGGGESPSGDYTFRIREAGGSLLNHQDASGRRSFSLRSHRFPVPARHSYGDGYGAGRGHRGQDVFAGCGKRLLAARAGKVKFVGRGSSAGHYLVIDGARTTRDYVYMHLKRRPAVREGERVKAGQRIGKVGQTGNASGCHLHFELWSGPGWYSGGKPSRNVRKKLRRWDRHS